MTGSSAHPKKSQLRVCIFWWFCHLALLQDFKIGVAARFRPSMAISDTSEEDGVVLPLHQKVQLVRKQLGCTSKEAVSLIMQKQRRLKTGKTSLTGDGLFQPCLSPGYEKENRQQNTQLIISNEKNIEVARGQTSPNSFPSSIICCLLSLLMSIIHSSIFLWQEIEEVSSDVRCSILSVQEEKASVPKLNSKTSKV